MSRSKNNDSSCEKDILSNSNNNKSLSNEVMQKEELNSPLNDNLFDSINNRNELKDS